ncbi:MAG: ATP-binding protein [Bacteroidota bacterium]
MERSIHRHLISWKNAPRRKVLLLRGARQVGKTWSARYLGSHFEHFLEINFELDKKVHDFFEQSLDPNDLCLNLSAYYNIPIENGKTLLFFDEIQSCIPAISSLRFFYEKRPGLHLIAAGSLLEFALEELPSYGLGRIESIWMYPMSFDEFLLAKGEEQLLQLKGNANPDKPLNKVFHEKLIVLFRQFLLLGGLPEVIQTFIDAHDFGPAIKVIHQLIDGLDDDFAKYKKRVPVSRLRTIFDSIANQAGSKFNLSKSSKEANHGQIKEAITLLTQAGLVYKVQHTAANGFPLGAEINPKKFKLLMFDHGIFQQILGLNVSELLLPSDYAGIFRGALAELFVGLEIIKYQTPFSRPHLYYWHRDKRGSQAEVDYLLQIKNQICPLEVKSGTQGKMQSLHLFLKEKQRTLGLRSSLENFAQYQQIDVIPLYAISHLFTNENS